MDRTPFTTFRNQTNPMFIVGRTLASNNDTFLLKDKCERVILTSVDDTDAIVSVQLNSTDKSTITVGATDDAGATITTDFNINFIGLRSGN